MRYLVIPLLALCAPICWSGEVVASENCPGNYGAKLDSLQGKVLFDADGKGQWQQAKLYNIICEGSRVKVEPYSRASLTLPNGIILRLDANTMLSLNGIAPSERTFLSLLKGFVHFISRTPKRLEISNPIANAGPEGTEFAMQADEASASLWVYEGGVRFFNAQGSLNLKPGQSAQTLLGQAPQTQINITPQDAVSWALYYPPLIPYPEPTANIDADIRKAIQDFRQGHSKEALLQLEKFSQQKQNLYFFKVRGAMRLTIGQVALALQDIQTILEKNPKDAEALALQSVLALTQNNKQEALDLANRATESDTHSASAYSALSYAEQGRFELDKALEAADQAVNLAPHDAMLWARKAELELAKNLNNESQESAKRALELDANLERTQTVMGFSYLTRMKTDEALQTFEKAVTLDSTSPLARLGLGLTKIRKGDLAEGRQDLEIAAILDPNNSLIRSYLGKAYFEEKRNPLAQDQFSLAKERDPKDPTPWFYDAIKKQTENRPIEALQDLQTAIELNNNRAVYRSKQLLDNDLAIRNTSLARIYDDLGFDSRATVEATNSLAIDPSNYSAHRFLSDAYVRLPRREIAQVSELLQSQLLQPLNNNPIQPHLSVKGLNAISGIGPTDPSFKDFTNAFQRNDNQFFISGFAGNHRTKGDEAVLSGIHDNLSYSLGQYHFDTDGFRKDANVTHDLYNAFMQAAITPDINVQLELRKRHTEQGDLRMMLEESFVPSEKRKLDQNTGRIGIKISLNPESQLLGSLIYSDRKELLLDSPQMDEYGYSYPSQAFDHQKAINAEGQYLFDGKYVNIVIGGGANKIDYQQNYVADEISYIDDCGLQAAPCTSNAGTLITTNQTIESYGLYNYTNIALPGNIHTTLGFSYESYQKTQEEKDPEILRRAYPKLGFQWLATDRLRLRAAYLGTVKRQLIVDQTIEPTQVAGFNQFYDDFNGDRTMLKGAGMDAKLGQNIFTGVEFTDRTIRSTLGVGASNFTYTNRENTMHGYFYWTPQPYWAFSFEGQHERYKQAESYILETTQIPITIKYFAPTGFFAQLAPRYVWQKSIDIKKTSDGELKSSFPIWDMSVGYRLPQKRGIISLNVQNVANQKFNFQDSSFRTSDQIGVVHPFAPARTIMFRTVLSF